METLGNLPVIRHSFDDRIDVLTLNRPARRNAFSLEMLDLLIEHFDESAKRQIPLVIIRGSDPVFCSGLDLREAVGAMGESFENTGNERPPVYRMFQRVVDLLFRVMTYPGIVAAQAQRAAYGGGAALLAVCDRVVVTDSFSLCFPEKHHQLRPALLNPFLSRVIEPELLKQMVETGDPIDAATMLNGGIADLIVKQECLEETTITFCQELLSSDKKSSKRCKKEFPSDRELQVALKDHWASWCEPKTQECLKAFLNRK